MTAALGGDMARGHVQVMTTALALGSQPTTLAYLGFRATAQGPRGNILVCAD